MPRAWGGTPRESPWEVALPAVLVVPIHLDALCLDADRDVTEPTADFSALPYVDPVSRRDVNAQVPYLSEAILSRPFADQGLRLRAGVHLHWALPDAMTRITQQDGSSQIASAPNRWLITRSRSGTIEQQWVVESDYLADVDTGGVTYPVFGPGTSAGKPYGYLGRRVPLSLWQEGTDRSHYLSAFSAVGYGEPTFAAFYPNCHSVFGFHDPDYVGIPPAGLSYDVVGWYADTAVDLLRETVRTARDGESWASAVQRRLGWTVTDPPTEPPERMTCYARLTFAAGATDTNPLLEATEAGLCIGNTPTEALAAHLGNVLPGVDPARHDEIEQLLEAIAFADDLEATQLDLGIGLLEARHDTTFRSLSSGLLWTIRRRDDVPTVSVEGQRTEADASQRQLREQLVLPHELGDLLDQLNAAQAAHDRAGSDIDSFREQLFADWYKYMLCCYPPETSREGYPDPDEVQFFLRRKIAYLQQQIASRGSLPPAPTDGDTLGRRLTTAQQAVEDALAVFNGQVKDAASTFELRRIAAPQFYQPNEPAVLLTGDAATPSNRYGRDGDLRKDGTLDCHVRDMAPAGFTSALEVADGRQDIASGFADLGRPDIAVATWSTQPWHPVLLQWEVEFFPSSQGNNLDPGNTSYSSQFVLDNYQLAPLDVELRLRAGHDVPDKGANTYTGSTPLSSAARPVLTARVLRYLQRPVLAAYNTAAAEAGQPLLDDTSFIDTPEVALDWYRAHGDDPQILTLMDVYEHLKTNEGSNLSSSLGGFNDALLMRRLTRQLPVADPLGFASYRDFTEQEVMPAVDGQTQVAPVPLSDFNPIRAGALRVLQLRLVDNFGITFDVNVGHIATTTELRVPNHQDWVAMPPRLAQPARVDVRWLDSDHDVREMNDVPVTSPICGWLVPNNLDGSLAVFAADGRALGAVLALADVEQPSRAQWRPAPGGEPSSGPGSIGNEHLRRVVKWLQSQGGEEVGTFLETVDDALGSIDPHSSAENSSSAFLLGRPIAVVRAQVNLELLGWPAVHQDWNVFRQDMRRSSRETNDFPLVRFPLRIGEHGRLSDGVVGFWPETAAGELIAPFRPVQQPGDTDDAWHIDQSLDAPPAFLTILFDPRARLHVTSGVLPTKSLTIPAEQFADALRQMEVTFFSAPVLSDGELLDLPLPSEPGYLWSWLEQSRAGWHELSTAPTLRRDVLDGQPMPGVDATTVWTGLLAAGWLSALDEQTALITPEEERGPLPAALEAIHPQLTELLDRPTIELPQLGARFPAQPTVREGWLKLRPLPAPTRGGP